MQPSDSPHLVRRFGLLQAVALNMSNMIGIGPFITIPALMTAMGGPESMIGWFVGLAITIPDGMVWSELGAAMPGSGGSYLYLKRGFGPKWGRFVAFLFIWQFILSGPLEIASGFIGFGQYLTYIFPSLTRGQLNMVSTAVGLLAILILYRRITSIAWITVSLWAGTLLTLAIVLISGWTHMDFSLIQFDSSRLEFSIGFLMGLGAASRVAIYDFLGYYDICFIGEEVKRPARTIPRSILISILAVAGIYILLHLAIMGNIPWRDFVPATDPPMPVVSVMMEKNHGPFLAKAVTLMVLWTAFAAIFALMLGYSRIPFAAAREGQFFEIFSRIHPTKQFPHVSLVVIGVVSIACSFFDLMTVIDALMTTRILVQFIGQIAAVIVLRIAQPAMERPYRMWLYPLPCFIALAGWLFLFSTMSVKLMLFGGLVLSLGCVGFLVWSWINKTWPFGGVEERTPEPER